MSFALLAAVISAQKSNTSQCSNDGECPTDVNSTCVVSSNGQGNCYPSCTLTSDERPCKLGQACDALPQISTMQYGYCPDPTVCGGFVGADCKDDRNPFCIDDPRDDCDPKDGDADCEGICVSETASPTPTSTVLSLGPRTTSVPTDQSCGGLLGKACPTGYVCEDNPKDSCGTKEGGADCPGICLKERLCDSRGLPPCFKGEKCAHESGCDGAADCPGVCKPKKLPRTPLSEGKRLTGNDRGIGRAA